MVAIPRDKIANAILNRGIGLKAVSRIKSPTSAKVSVTSPGCIGNISLTALRPNACLQKRHHMHQMFGVLVTDIVDLRRRAGGVIGIAGKSIDNANTNAKRHRYG